MALINGGALLDFRTKEGLTALHKAVERNNLEALKVIIFVCFILLTAYSFLVSYL